MTTLLAILTIPFSVATGFYFGWRAWLQEETSGLKRPLQARAVSASLALISFGPLIVAAIACGWIRKGFYPWAAGLACLVAIALVIAIIRVEEMDEQGRRIRESRFQAKKMLEQAKASGEFIGPPARKRR